jgi:uncharacterized protein (AIM24 family)
MADSAPTPFDQGLFLVHLNRGMENFERRNFAIAERELEAARRMRPADQRVLNLLGLVYFKREKYTESAGIYRRLIDGNPDSYILHFNNGLICFKLGSLDQAEAAFLKALDLKPDNQKINFYLGNIYEKKGQHYNAIFQYRKAGANIMVKRIQAKISSEKSGGDGRVDHSSTGPDSEVDTHGEAVPMLTLNDIDPEQILTALNDTSPMGSPTPAVDSPTPDEGVGSEDETSDDELAGDDPTMPPRSMLSTPPADLAEKVLVGEPAKPAPPAREGPEDRDDETGPLLPTVVRLTDPVVPDQPLNEVASSKSLSVASKELFTAAPMERRSGSRRSGDQTLALKVPPIIAGETAGQTPDDSPREPTSLREDGDDRTPHLYSQLRRRDDSFRYLENNLMEVTFSGKVFIKQGTIYSYSGNLTFWVKPQREEGAPSLVIVSGTGRLLLTDREREITVLQVNGEEIFVEPSHLLACQETLTPRYAVIEREGGEPQPQLHVLSVQGTGLVALSVSTKPLVLAVTPGYPVNVSSANVISWSGELTPGIVEDEALAELMSPHPRTSLNIRLEGSGKVMMEKTTQ